MEFIPDLWLVESSTFNIVVIISLFAPISLLGCFCFCPISQTYDDDEPVLSYNSYQDYLGKVNSMEEASRDTLDFVKDVHSKRYLNIRDSGAYQDEDNQVI